MKFFKLAVWFITCRVALSSEVPTQVLSISPFNASSTDTSSWSHRARDDVPQNVEAFDDLKTASTNFSLQDSTVFLSMKNFSASASQQSCEGGHANEEGFVSFDREKPSRAATAAAVFASLLILLANRKKKVKVTDLCIYPIKSCAGQHLQTAQVTQSGFVGDREMQLIDSDGCYIADTLKEWADLLKLFPKLNGQKLVVTSPKIDGALEIDLSKAPKTPIWVYEIYDDYSYFLLEDCGDEASKWFQKALGWDDVRLASTGKDYERHAYVTAKQGDPIPTKNDPPISLASTSPYLLTNMASLRDLNYRLRARGKEPVEMDRMRSNIVIDGLLPWEEDSLRRIRIGKTEFHVWQRCGRCRCITVNHDTLETSPEPLATMNTFRERAHGQRNFGMYLIPVEGSLGSDSFISNCDTVEILEYHTERREEWERLFSKSALREWRRQHGTHNTLLSVFKL